MDPPSHAEANDWEDEPAHVNEGVIVTGGCEWIGDDFPLWELVSNELSTQKKELVQWVTSRCLVTDGITYFLDCTNVASSAQLESKPAAEELVEKIDILAPVDFEAALSGFYLIMKRVAYSIWRILRSVCNSTWRLMFSAEFSLLGPIVTYFPHPRVVDNAGGNEHTRMYAFVLMPIMMPHLFACPTRIQSSSRRRPSTRSWSPPGTTRRSISCGGAGRRSRITSRTHL